MFSAKGEKIIPNITITIFFSEQLLFFYTDRNQRCIYYPSICMPLILQNEILKNIVGFYIIKRTWRIAGKIFLTTEKYAGYYLV